jgi:TolB-like protein
MMNKTLLNLLLILIPLFVSGNDKIVIEVLEKQKIYSSFIPTKQQIIGVAEKGEIIYPLYEQKINNYYAFILSNGKKGYINGRYTSLVKPKPKPIAEIDHGIGGETPPADVSLLKNDIPSLPPPPFFPAFIAVIDFTGNNVSEGDCITLTDRLSIELCNTRYFKVYDQEVMKKILKKQKFQYSGCVTDTCMVEIGRMIGVNQIVGGSISKVGNVYSVSARIINVKTGEIENTGVYDHTGDIGGLLTEGMIRVAIELIK